MISRINKEPFLLLAGDLFFFALSLYGALLLRFWELPTRERFEGHFLPFAIVFFVWVLTYFVFDLYRKHNAAFRRRLFSVIVRAHAAGALLTALIFYFSVFEITPRTVLFLYTFVSLLFVLLWRLVLVDRLSRGELERAVLLSTRSELIELRAELAHNPKYNLELVDLANPEEFVRSKIQVVIFDPGTPEFKQHEALLYSLVLRGVRFVDARQVYEEIFDREPLSLLDEGWFLANITNFPKTGYGLAKRIMDIALSVPLALLSLLFYPFAIFAIKMDDGGPIFSVQERVGKNGEAMKLFKFRTMTNANDGGKWGTGNVNRVTKVGAVLRKTRIDELPQLWNVLAGDISLIGPRPEFAQAVAQYDAAIPYYNMRHIIKPGLSGWAQIYHDNHPHHGLAIEDTRDKLSYDLYYVKNRSFWLDLKIALKTVKTLLSAVGV